MFREPSNLVEASFTDHAGADFESRALTENRVAAQGRFHLPDGARVGCPLAATADLILRSALFVVSPPHSRPIRRVLLRALLSPGRSLCRMRIGILRNKRQDQRPPAKADCRRFLRGSSRPRRPNAANRQVPQCRYPRSPLRQSFPRRPRESRCDGGLWGRRPTADPVRVLSSPKARRQAAVVVATHMDIEPRFARATRLTLSRGTRTSLPEFGHQT
jgi:hypothetical protein